MNWKGCRKDVWRVKIKQDTITFVSGCPSSCHWLRQCAVAAKIMEFIQVIQHKQCRRIPIWASKCRSHGGYIPCDLLILFPFPWLILSPCHFSFFQSISSTHLHACTYTASRWREISSCPINRCRRTKIEHVSSGAIQRWQGIYHDGPSPFPHPVFPGLQPSQVLWLITPAVEQQENSAEASFWQEKTHNKRILSRRKDESFVSALHSTPTSRNESMFWISHVHSDSKHQRERGDRKHPISLASYASKFSFEHLCSLLLDEYLVMLCS